MEFTTMGELRETAILLDTNQILKNEYPGQPCQRLILKHWQNMPKKTFNTKNGVLVFTDDTNTLYAIPNFNGLVALLRSNGYRQNYLMPVLLADGYYPQIHSDSVYWADLQMKFRQQYA